MVDAVDVRLTFSSRPFRNNIFRCSFKILALDHYSSSDSELINFYLRLTLLQNKPSSIPNKHYQGTIKAKKLEQHYYNSETGMSWWKVSTGDVTKK